MLVWGKDREDSENFKLSLLSAFSIYTGDLFPTYLF